MKPGEIEAIQWDGTFESFEKIREWSGGNPPAVNYREFDDGEDDTTHLMIHTLEGAMRADVGDWVIRGIQGEFYPCKRTLNARTGTSA